MFFNQDGNSVFFAFIEPVCVEKFSTKVFSFLLQEAGKKRKLFFLVWTAKLLPQHSKCRHMNLGGELLKVR